MFSPKNPQISGQGGTMASEREFSILTRALTAGTLVSELTESSDAKYDVRTRSARAQVDGSCVYYPAARVPLYSGSLYYILRYTEARRNPTFLVLVPRSHAMFEHRAATHRASYNPRLPRGSCLHKQMCAVVPPKFFFSTTA